MNACYSVPGLHFSLVDALRAWSDHDIGVPPLPVYSVALQALQSKLLC